MIELQKENGDDKTTDADTGFLTNKQTRKRAEEKQNEVNENTRRSTLKHIRRTMSLIFPVP
eukprot:1478371-Heterocapsa_arctica.AAC.1